MKGKLLFVFALIFMLSSCEGILGGNKKPVENPPVGNETTGNETTGNETTGNETTGNETTGNETTGNENSGDDAVGDETPGDDTAGNETPGDDTTGNETSGDDTAGNETPGDQTTGNEDATTTSDYDFAIGKTSLEMVKNMAMGWNLGNFMDATAQDSVKNSSKSYEGYWRGDVVVSKDMITAVKKAGFKSIRMPVSWHNYVDAGNDYKVNTAWMTRVKEIVDYAYDQNMCVIINIHHDNMAEGNLSKVSGYTISKDKNEQELSKAYIKSIWKQVAEAFKDYDQKLVFELLNEPRCVGKDWEWGFYYDNGEMTAKEANDIITEYEQLALDTIRSVSGNENRYVVVPAYACSDATVSDYTLPVDSASDKMIYSFHAYSPYTFAMQKNSEGGHSNFTADDKNSIAWQFKTVREVIDRQDKKVGIIIGEASASNKGNLSDREAWFEYFFDESYNKYGYATFLWDNGSSLPDENDGERHGYLNLSDNSWYFPTLIEKAHKSVYGE